MPPIDYTKIRNKIVRPEDGQDVVRLRTGEVEAINANGTVDILLSGVVMTDLPRLEGLLLAEGDSVQLLSYRGSLLVLGSVASSSESPIMMVGEPVMLTSDSATWTGTESGSLMSITVPVIIGRLYRVDFTCNTATTAQTFPITSANLEIPIMRIREDNASGNQLTQDSVPFGNASGNGVKITTFALYEADATEAKTFVITGQRNGAGSGGTHRIEADPNRPAILMVNQLRKAI
jgi:hypothetical protein